MADKKMTPDELASVLSAEKARAVAVSGGELSSQRERALDYYNGDMSSDMPSIEGRSSAVSTDVSDVIEGMMPGLMDIFFGADNVVEFNPTSPEDEQAAEQETDVVNWIFLQQNPGFLILYTFIKDALLSKVGITKVWWDEGEEEEEETYYDLTTDQLAGILMDEEVEVIEHTAHMNDAAPVPA
jgi:hypothetical protein